MAFSIVEEDRPGSHRVFVLSDDNGCFVEICPELGFNCYRWHIPEGEVLYATPEFFTENRPTRSGFPILFPFPNRIRDGRYTWEGKEYQLPLDDPAGKNAIHGFVCQRPWRVAGQGIMEESAWLVAKFHGSIDDADTLSHWPADYRILVTYQFFGRRLRVAARIRNSGAMPMPFGLGFHPYFATDWLGGEAALVKVSANRHWVLVNSLPTGEQATVAGTRDLREARRFGELTLDDILTDLPRAVSQNDVCWRGTIENHDRSLHMFTSSDFTELVVFTPPHRQAICMEPYTCVTDAINLQQKGISSGLRILSPGESWRGVVEVHC
ncbi:MAG: aldose 1-epimerase [Gemmataceae bacterium]|nr:aldose 1-epimerase [Gemmataceae bacterium]